MKLSEFCLAVFIILLCFSVQNPQSYRALISRNATIDASVTGTWCWNHRQVAYSFEVGAKEFANSTYWLRRECDRIKVGDTIKVLYDPVSPEVNTTMSAADAFDHYTTDFLFKVVAIVVLLGVLLYKSFGVAR